MILLNTCQLTKFGAAQLMFGDHVPTGCNTVQYDSVMNHPGCVI
jgi:hypothetical protein